MGNQPGLDGLRAVSVIAVILYHAGFGWMLGGFLGVEVFFVISGFLITTLLLEEQGRAGRIALAQFWIRRGRRLLPALFVMLAAVGLWAALLGDDVQAATFRRDLPWSLFYVANWGQIVGEVPYFAAEDPPLLRHLWSLAVEEQWYLIWPLVVIGLISLRLPRVRVFQILSLTALGTMVLMAVVQSQGTNWLPFGWFAGADRTNFNYLSTITRSGGLLLGAAAAFVWRPWRSDGASRVPSAVLDRSMGVVLGLLLCCFIGADLTAGWMYPWVLGAVSVLSLVAVAIVVHPAAAGSRWLLGAPSLVAIGRRSYGLYLWHWPIFVFAGATDGSYGRFLWALGVSVLVSEASYRFIETPVRKYGWRAWWDSIRPVSPTGLVPAAAVAVVAVGLTVFYMSLEPVDVAAGGADVEFAGVEGVAPPTSVVAAAAPPPSTIPGIPLTIVGDSQAHSLAVNQPSGVEEVFDITNGSLNGCSVYDSGKIRTERPGFKNTFAVCGDWVEHWAETTEGADVALIVLGAWDVFDIEIDGTTYPFASPELDAMFVGNLTTGIDVIASGGTRVAVLEAACMRPVSAEGAAVPPLPERADDERVAHMNMLLRRAVEGRPDVATFVEGPDEWCNDEAIATDIGYRWDGVHVYKPGANLIYEKIAPELLALAG